MSRRYRVPRLVYTSSNCLWGSSIDHAIAEDEPPAPIEPYGRSKLEGERLLKGYEHDLIVVTLRCPTIIDAGRLGLLTILKCLWTSARDTHKTPASKETAPQRLQWGSLLEPKPLAS